MKAFRWLALLLVLVGAMLFLMRGKSGSSATSAPAAQTEELSAETSATPAAPIVPPASEVAPLVAAATTASPTAASFDPFEGANHLQVIVLNINNQPLEGATIRTAFRGESRRPAHTNLVRTFTTSARGMADVLWPTQKLEQFELAISKDEYGPRKMIWDLKAGDQVPANYTVKLRGSVHIGGFVVDPEGSPIVEALVSLGRFWTGSDQMKYQGEEADFPMQKHTTGTDGRWAARNLPPELLERISITASHSNYLENRVTVDRAPGIFPELQAGTYKLVLTRGLSARGRVVNEQQQPVAGADVWVGRRYSSGRKQTKADEQGRFTFSNVSTGRVDFSASAEGYAPNYKNQEVSAAMEEVVIQLEKGTIIRGVVQDEVQQPIEDVRVVLEGDSTYDRIEFSTKTDSAGKFEWRSAPNKPMQFYVGKLGYQQKRGVLLKPAEDNVVTLKQNRKVSGQVVDAETEKPVTRFTAASGRSHGENQFYADSGTSKEFRSEQGVFTLELHEENANAAQVTADGYAEQVQMLPAAENGEVKVLFKLKPSPSLVGLVVTPDGRPVADARVALVDNAFGGGRSVQFKRGRIESQGARSKMITTDAEGSFQIPSPPEAGMVIAANGAGYGSATVAEVRTTGFITLQGFGRIDGMLLQGSTPGAGQEVLLTSPNAAINFDWESARKTTDAQGLFSFEDVPAGNFAIVRLIKTSSRSWQHSHSTPIVVKAGQTTDVVLGGTDGTLQGTVKFETPPADNDYRLNAALSTVMPKLPEGLTQEQIRAYVSSEQWKEQVKQNKHYSATVNPDGSLRVDSVVPGQYTLRVSAQKNGEEEYRSQPIASGEVTVTVPEGASPATPIHIGEVLLKPNKR